VSTTTVIGACGKQAHPSKDAATAHLAGLLRKGANRLNVYRCRLCSRSGQPKVWHVGHYPGAGSRR
jgi:hypothetical protein